jgi:hypothetical protein
LAGLGFTSVSQIVEAFQSATGVALSSAEALFESIARFITVTGEQIVKAVKDATGVDLSSPQKLVESIADLITVTAQQIVSTVKAATGVDLETPAKLAGSIAHLLTLTAEQVVGGVLNATVVPPLQLLAGLLTGQQIQNGTVTQEKVATRDPSNLVWNGDFEDGATNWELTSTTVQSGNVFQGSRALTLTAPASAVSTNAVNCAAGDQFTLTGWLNHPSDAPGGGLVLQSSDGTSWNDVTPDSVIPSGATESGAWVKVTVLATAPTGAVKVRAAVKTTGSGTLHADRVELRRAYATAQDVAQVGSTTADLSKAVVTLANATYATRSYLSPFSRNFGNAFEDATFDRGMLRYQPFASDYTSGPGSSHYHNFSGASSGSGTTDAEAAHTHKLTAASMRVLPVFTPTLGRLYVLPISCEANRVYSQAILQTTGTAVPSRFYLAVGQIDRSTGDVTRVYDFGDVRGSLVTGTGKLFDQLFNTTTNISASAGSVNCLLVLQTGGAAMPLAAVSDVAEQTSGVPLYPKYLTGQSTATNLTSIPATVANSSLATGYVQTWAWGALSQPYANQVDQDSTFVDDFNRSNANTLGPMWSVSANTFQINANAAQLVPNGLQLGGRNTAVYAQAFLSNNQSVEATIKTFSTTGLFGLVLRRNTQGTAWAQMLVRSNKATLEFSVNGTATEYATASISNVQAGSKFRLSVSGNVFTGYLNNTPLWSYTDTGGLLANGTQTRKWGFLMDYAALNSGVPSPIDQIVATSTVA